MFYALYHHIEFVGLQCDILCPEGGICTKSTAWPKLQSLQKLHLAFNPKVYYDK